MTARIPKTFEELAKIGELGAQLGVPKEALLDFTEAVAKLGATTNLTTEEAATALAQIATILQVPIAEISRMGSAVVGLGNNFSTTETKIVDFAKRISGAGAIVGLSVADVFGIATAFSSVGIEAEAGGTAVSEGLVRIQKAVADGGEELEDFASLTGQTAKEFAAAWKDDAAGQFTRVLEGIGKSGDRASQVIEQLFGSSSQLFRSFASVANAGDTLKRAVELANTEFENNNALQEEAQKRFANTESQLAIQENKWRLFGSYLGKNFLPILVSVTSFFTETVPAAFIKTQAALVLLVGKFANAYARVSAFFSDFSDNAGILGQNLTRVLGIIGDNIGVFARNAGKVFGWLGENIGIAFGNIGPLAKTGLNLALEAVEKGVNDAITLVNQLTEKLKALPVVGESLANAVKIGPVNLPDFGAQKIRSFNSPGSDLETFASVSDGWAEPFRDSSAAVREQTNQAIAAAYLDAEKALQELQGNAGRAEEQTMAEIRKNLEARQAELRELLQKIEDEKKSKSKGGGKDSEAERRVKTLEEVARREIETVKASVRTEQEKADAIKAIEERLQDDVLRARGQTLELELRQNDRRLAAIKEEEAAAKEADKAQMESQERLFAFRAAREKEAVAASTASASEKARRLKEIDERLERELAELRGDTSKSDAKSAEARVQAELEAEKKVRAAREDTFEKTTDRISDNLSDVEKLAEAYGEFGEKIKEVSEEGAKEVSRLSEEISELQEKIGANAAKRQNSLAERGLEIDKEILDTRKQISELRNEGVDVARAEQIGRESLLAIERGGGGTIQMGGVAVDTGDLLQALDLQQKLKDLEAERDLVNSSTTEQERATALADSQKSKAERIIEETAAERAKLEQELAAAEERKRAKEEEIEREKTAIEEKRTLVLARIQEEKDQTRDLYADLREQDRSYTKDFGEQIGERMEYLDGLLAKARETQAALQAAELMKASSAADSSKVVNNTMTANINNDVDAESFLRALERKIGI